MKWTNKKAKYNYNILTSFDSGIQLLGSEIKSIRNGKISLNESFCSFINNELYVFNMFIGKYYMSTSYIIDCKRKRKLLLKRSELNKLNNKVSKLGITIIPLYLYINNKGLAKLNIALAKGKKYYDKRNAIKNRDMKRDFNRYITNR